MGSAGKLYNIEWNEFLPRSLTERTDEGRRMVFGKKAAVCSLWSGETKKMIFIFICGMMILFFSIPVGLCSKPQSEERRRGVPHSGGK